MYSTDLLFFPSNNFQILEPITSTMEKFEVALASNPAHERGEIVENAETLKKIQIKNNRGEFLSTMELLEILIKIPTSGQRSQVVSAIFDLFKKGVPGSNYEGVLKFLAE